MLNVSSKAHKLADKLPETAAPIPLRWGIGVAVLLTLICFVLSQILAQIVVTFIPSLLGWSSSHANDWVQNAPLANFLYVLLAESLIIGTLLWFLHHKKTSLQLAVSLRRPQWLDAIYTCVGFVAYLVVYATVLITVTNFLPINTGQEQAVGFAHGIRGIGLIMAFISLAILPPFVEETVFRGFLFGTLRRRKVPFWAATLVVSLLFGMMHLFGGAGGSLIWIAFLDTFVLSLALCFLREKTGSIWASIGLHMLKNVVVFINLFIIGTR
jgi:membrane protease YdiL (CAAX protease family)